MLFRRACPGATGIEVLLGHSGGPFFAGRDAGAWGIPKGEYSDDEDPYAAACREFTEELGLPVPPGSPIALGEAVQHNRKVVAVWAIEADLDPATISPGTFTMPWPPRSGTMQEFPEIDRVAWFEPAHAALLLIPGQDVFLDRLNALTG